jgi:hypothetical protein
MFQKFQKTWFQKKKNWKHYILVHLGSFGTIAILVQFGDSRTLIGFLRCKIWVLEARIHIMLWLPTKVGAMMTYNTTLGTNISPPMPLHHFTVHRVGCGHQCCRLDSWDTVKSTFSFQGSLYLLVDEFLKHFEPPIFLVFLEATWNRNYIYLLTANPTIVVQSL